MIYESQYAGRSTIQNTLTGSQVQLAANRLREPTYFDAALKSPLVFRDALAALHAVVVSDYKYRPRDRVEFQAWMAEQDRQFLAALPLRGLEAGRRMEVLAARRSELEALRNQRMQPFFRARRHYLEYVYTSQWEQWLLLDPVITVHPDEVSFEAFSRDESTYARLAAKQELFEDVKSFECGTTNIDFSVRLHEELERMRTYRKARFTIDPGGFTVAQEEEPAHREKKIDLPESWVNGFLQVHATMSMSLTHLRLAPVDLFNICRQLRRRHAKVSPRALRWELEPGKPGQVVLEPWELVIPLTSVFEGEKTTSIRTWGRDRLQVIQRLLSKAERIDLFLAGFGLPSFYVFDMGNVLFTLGLSGWTDNDWTGETRFDLLTKRLQVTADQLLTVYESLRSKRHATVDELSQATNLTAEHVRSSVSCLCQAGRAMVDLGGETIRHRDLFLLPFTKQEAVAAARKTLEEQSSPAAKAAREICERGMARFTSRRATPTGYKLTGSVRGSDGKRVRPLLEVDQQGQIVTASCTCKQYAQQQLTKGPCEHILALRLAHMDRLATET